ncbi:MAG: biotin/lipoate A/B protein ligase family protein [Pleurocapsa sp.]
MSSTWRLIPWMEESGKMQMAIDAWLLKQHQQGYPPILRFYTWHPATISLGYHQQNYPESWQQLCWQGKPLDIVRRPTGGRAVLHQGDLSYAVIASTLPGKRLEVYRQICEFLIIGWRSLGVELDYGMATKEYAQEHNCFASSTGADLITTTGAKAIGSAQLRRRQAILQHGSMRLNTDKELFETIFNQPAGDNLLELVAKCDRREPGLSIAKIIEVLTAAAIACFKIDLIEEPLSNAELQDIVNNFSLLRY